MPKRLPSDAPKKVLEARMLSAAATGDSRSCGRMSGLCRSHFYKVLAVILVAFLLFEYSFNLLAYPQKTARVVPSSISWMFGPSSGADSDVFNASFGNRTQSGEGSAGNGTGKGNSSVVAVSTTKSLELCPLVPPNLVGRLKVLLQAPSFDEMEKKFTHIMLGGRFKPKDCLARHRVAILIPYRDREDHLRVFLYNMHQMLPRQQIDYGIFVIEEVGQAKFNRAKLFNVGYLEALALYDYDCFIFHDVDLIPEDDRNLYTCPEQPRHMSVAIDTMQYSPDNVDLNDFLYADSAVIATEVTDEAIASDVRGNVQDGDDIELDEQDTCDVPSDREVVDVIDVLRRLEHCSGLLIAARPGSGPLTLSLTRPEPCPTGCPPDQARPVPGLMGA
ncbi:hypothetical protein HPB47_013160 [Ixodes persulcatus]|uniref:Uncharacterized protein n=1 Tax=Ixodes persulcatus TaxID=34615 RepID=A0AC60NRI2_IXOPE|nr:hypothetical protein HPB47_013160 [Ixodes persulcatus]